MFFKKLIKLIINKMIMLWIITSSLLQIVKCDNYEEYIQENYDYFTGYSIICWTIQLNNKIENSC